MTTDTPDGDIDDDWFHDHYGVEKHHDTLAHGHFSHASSGLYLPLHENAVLQMEFR